MWGKKNRLAPIKIPFAIAFKTDVIILFNLNCLFFNEDEQVVFLL